MKPQRFRSLREQIRISAVLFFACASVSALLFSPPAVADQLDDMKKFKDECGKETGDALVLYTDRTAGKLVEDYDPKIQCKENSGDEVPALSHNARQISPDVWNKRPSFITHSKNETEARKLGACRVVYLTMKEIFDLLHRHTVDYCADVKKNLDIALSCGGLKKECEDKFRRVKETIAGYSKIKEEIIQSARYLELTVKVSDDARKKYVDDLDVLEKEMRKNSTLANPLEKVDTITDRPDVKPSNGNARTKTLSEYYKLLVTNYINHALPIRAQLSQHGGRLISEHREASKQAVEFLGKLNTQVGNQTVIAKSMVDGLETMIAGIEKNGSVKDPSLTGKISTGLPVATGALGLGQQVLGNGNNNTPGPVALTGGSSTPSLATLAAVGAAGAALHSSLGSSASQGSAGTAPVGQQEAAKPLEPTQTTNLGDNGSKAGNVGSGHNELPGAGTKTDTAKADPVLPAGGAYPAFGAADGSSRMVASSKKMGRTPPPPAEAKASGSGDDTFNSFGGASMAPKPAPKGTQLSAGAEVANLLGQMKNLFNFDEGAPMGGGGSPGGAMPMDPGLPANGTEGEQVADGESAPATDGEVAASENPAIDQVQGSPFGKSDTTLFTRVHYRHTRCMERGLVLYQLGERVE